MNLFEQIINHGIQQKTSDIHLGVGFAPTFRLDGRIVFAKEFKPATHQQMEECLRRLLTDGELERLRQGCEVDTAFSYEKGARFRVHAYQERRGINIALRYLPELCPTLESLGMFDEYRGLFEKLLREPYGLLLVTGPTGAGKSTTLAAMIDYINTHKTDHVITIEDPIEYLHTSKQSLIKQREVGDGKDSASFPQALRSALREDPDVILVGEMRDRETIALAITAAETGHLVLSTLHTNTTYQAINRIVDVFPPDQQGQIRSQLSQNLAGIIAQRLIPKKQSGRAIALEILINTNAIKTQIRDNKLQTIQSTMQTSKAEGMILLKDYIARLIAEGLIDEEVGNRFLISQVAY